MSLCFLSRIIFLHINREVPIILNTAIYFVKPYVSLIQYVSHNHCCILKSSNERLHPMFILGGTKTPVVLETHPLKCGDISALRTSLISYSIRLKYVVFARRDKGPQRAKIILQIICRRRDTCPLQVAGVLSFQYRCRPYL